MTDALRLHQDRVDLLPVSEGTGNAAAALAGGPHSMPHSAPSETVVEVFNVEADGEIGVSDGLEAVLERFRYFDVVETKCTNEADKQHLLGVIEMGFGELGVFNSLVRSLVLNDILERQLTQRDIGTERDMTTQRSVPTTLTKRSAGSRSNLHTSDKVLPSMYGKA